MPKLWIDALTPKQALFTKAMLERAPSNVKCTVTTRDYSELNQFVRQIGLPQTSVGMHGGGNLLQKLEASVERQKELIEFASKNDFDFSLSYISPEAARVSFGLGIKHYICGDSPHAVAPCRLAIPLSQKLFSPFPISTTRWTQYGVKPSQVRKYHALDPWAWLLSKKRVQAKEVTGRVVIRLEEWFASYIKEGRGLSSTLSRLIKVIKKSGDFEILLVPRYDEQRTWAKKEFGEKCTVPHTTIDAFEELLRADLLVGGGGTMTQEAALLGVPNISYFPSAKIDVFYNYYFPRRLSVKATNPSQLADAALKLLKNIDREKASFVARAQKETKSFEDPVRFIFKHMLA